MKKNERIILTYERSEQVIFRIDRKRNGVWEIASRIFFSIGREKRRGMRDARGEDAFGRGKQYHCAVQNRRGRMNNFLR